MGECDAAIGRRIALRHGPIVAFTENCEFRYNLAQWSTYEPVMFVWIGSPM